MSDSEQRLIAQRILAALYEDWENHTGSSLDPVREEGGWDEDEFNEVLDKLNDKYGYIAIQGNTIEITPAGILRAEDSDVVPDTKVELHRKVRAHILEHLADLHDREGSRAHEGYEKIAEGAPVDEIEMLVDLELLTELGYVKAVSSNSFSITDGGLQHYRGADYEDIV